METKTGESLQIEKEDLRVNQTTQQGMEMASNEVFTIFLNTEINEDLLKEGLVRELIRAVQQYRKELNLPVEQRVNLTFHLSESFRVSIEQYKELLERNLLIKNISFNKKQNMKYVEVENEKVGIEVTI